MEHGAILTEIAVVILTALLLGSLLMRFRQPAILGYLLTGIVLGPSGLSLVQNRETVTLLAELGVQLLLFLVGMELNVRALRSHWKITLGSVTGQIVGSTAITVGLSWLVGWPLSYGVLLGFLMALSSTAVCVKMLESSGELHTDVGKITIGILIAQDLAFIPMMIFLKTLGGGGFEWGLLLKLLLAAAFIVGLIIYLGRRERVHIPFANHASKYTELASLLGLAFCFGASALSGVMELSTAYGAFLAGLFLGNSTERHAMINATRPIESVLIMVFFLSIGVLFDINYVWGHLRKIIVFVLLVTVFKTFLNVLILRLCRIEAPQAFLSSLMLSQVGEFSFILAGAGLAFGILNEDGRQLITAVTVLSLLFSPLWVYVARQLRGLGQPIFTSLGELPKVVLQLCRRS